MTVKVVVASYGFMRSEIAADHRVPGSARQDPRDASFEWHRTIVPGVAAELPDRPRVGWPGWQRRLPDSAAPA